MTFSLCRKNAIYSLTLLLTVLLSFPTLAQENRESASIWDVINTFKSAIETKDETLFLSLFHDQNVSWVGIISDKTLSLLKHKDEKFAKQPKVMNSTPKEFIQGITRSSGESKEVFKHVKINTDKEVASVSFDYEFFKSGKMSNFGQEHWQLINTKNGWKINAVNFSFTLAL